MNKCTDYILEYKSHGRLLVSDGSLGRRVHTILEKLLDGSMGGLSTRRYLPTSGSPPSHTLASNRPVRYWIGTVDSRHLSSEGEWMKFGRITHDPKVMGGKPCIRGLRVTVGTIVGLLASGESRDRILGAYPYLESADLDEALRYAAWRLEEREEELVAR